MAGMRLLDAKFESMVPNPDILLLMTILEPEAAEADGAACVGDAPKRKLLEPPPFGDGDVCVGDLPKRKLTIAELILFVPPEAEVIK